MFSSEICSRFLSYYPLKQGLKQNDDHRIKWLRWLFLSYYPLKQGLKRAQGAIKTGIEADGFLSYYPLKQGLKHDNDPVGTPSLAIIFILLSIKTRIETDINPIMQSLFLKFLSYYPLKQGLKLIMSSNTTDLPLNFYPTIH